MSELKAQIQTALTNFASGPLLDAAKSLLKILGYESERTFQLLPNTYKGLSEMFLSETARFDPEKAKVNEWESIDLLFQLTEGDIRKSHSLFENKKVDNTIIESYLFFALSLTGEKYSRGDLVKITREINRLTSMPSMILFQYSGCLTLAVIDRRLHKRESAKDVLEKVTLIKDITITAPHRAHIEILHDLALSTLIQEFSVSDFVALHRAWRKVLDTSELNRRFYRELANWYFWAVQEVEFPDDGEKNREVRNATGVIRLITRLIFIWFLKEKGLIPHDLFNQARLKDILTFTDKNRSTYYKAILQNLFFATLNTEMNKDKPGSRKFRGKRQEGRDQHYMIHNVFRYEDYFLRPQDTLKKYFEDIPFLNGGLFECLDKGITVNGKEKVLRTDGFSDHPKSGLKVPDSLFFSSEQPVDLNATYGTKNKTYKVRGLIDILDRYKFTVDENTPIEEEIALDPELLGKVFENLLASYNPETQTTARKQTGSFYTPREIVNYMVDETLLAYLQTALPCPPVGKGDTSGSRFRHLLSYTDAPHHFSPEEVDTLIDAIDAVKILDPACGSGAFPMGVLHKLVYVLGKLDPQNKKWKQKQIDKVLEVPDSTVREKLVEDIEESFQNNELDYGRKLYLIENCIFGVDIQPIAVQIAKLRFFISLVADQKIHPQKENLGVRPLPNLETKFVAANTLLGIEKPKVLHLSMNLAAIDRKEKELKQVRERHFTARTQQTKNRWREEDRRLRSEIAELLREDGWDNEVAHTLAVWDPYDQNASAGFFDPEWMFGVPDGFAVVIGNPPYVRQEAIKAQKERFLKEYGAFFCGTADLYTYFYKKGVALLRPGGHLCFIAPNKFMRAGYGKNTRALLISEAMPKIILDFGDLPIFDATTYPSILLVEKTSTTSSSRGEGYSFSPPLRGGDEGEGVFLAATFTEEAQLERIEETLSSIGFSMPVSALKTEGWNLEQPAVLALMEKLRTKGVPLGEYVQGRFYRGVLTGLNEAFVIDEETRQRLIAEDPKSAELIKPWLRGRDIRKWKAEWAGLYVINIPSSANRQWPWSKKKTEQQARAAFEHSFPAICKHLSQWESKLRVRDDQGKFWWELRSCAYYQEFEKPKIVYADIAQESKFTYDESKAFLGNTAYIIPTNEKWLVGLLNSSIIWWFYLNISSTIRGGFVRFIAQYMEQLPIPPASDKQKASIIERVQTILADPYSPEVPRFEKEIDALIYQLYGLTQDEIALVDRNSAA